MGEPDIANRAELKISLAGKANAYKLEYNSEQLNPDLYRVHLKSDFNMQDFGIDPPTALMGLIKVDKKISIEIDLYISMEDY
jgi:hypothetical protein